jgi:hypothetical protein
VFHGTTVLRTEIVWGFVAHEGAYSSNIVVQSMM